MATTTTTTTSNILTEMGFLSVLGNRNNCTGGKSRVAKRYSNKNLFSTQISYAGSSNGERNEREWGKKRKKRLKILSKRNSFPFEINS